MECTYFRTQNVAQRYFEDDSGSPRDDAHPLDANHNGIACEHGGPG